MNKVVLKPGAAAGEYRLLVDDVDISEVVKADGLRLYFHEGRPRVDLVLLPVEVRVEVPDAVVQVVEALS